MVARIRAGLSQSPLAWGGPTLRPKDTGDHRSGKHPCELFLRLFVPLGFSIYFVIMNCNGIVTTLVHVADIDYIAV